MKPYFLLPAFALLLTGCTTTDPVETAAKPVWEAGPASVSIAGTPFLTSGPIVEEGDPAPEFSAYAEKFETISLSNFKGRPVLISSVPSLDTPVCSKQTQVFNELLAKLPEDVAVITISMDQPFAQKRFCGEHQITQMWVLSDTARREFGTRYGLLIPERGVLARAVMVVGRDGRLSYVEVVPELTQDPDFAAAIVAANIAAKAPAPSPTPAP